MKAVIVEIKDGVAAVLSDDGCIETIKNNNYEIGQVIKMKSTKIHFTKKIATFAASAAAVVVLGIGSWAYASPYSYVSLDVNPSIEYTLNRFDRVLKVRAVNDDGEEILKEIDLADLENKTIEDAIIATVHEISNFGYFEGTTEGGIVITTSGENEVKAEELAQDLQEAVETEVAENGDTVVVEAVSIGLDRVEEARELGVTPGKLNLVQKLQAAATDPAAIDLEEWLNKPVKDIMKATKAYRKGTTVSGSAITIEEDDQDDDKNVEKKNEQKANEKAVKAQNKANDQAVKAQEKADEKAAKAQEKADKAQIKADEKAAKAQNKADEKAAKVQNKSNNGNSVNKAVKGPKANNIQTETDNTNNQNVNKGTFEKDADEADRTNDKAATQKGNSSNNSNGKSNGNNGNNGKKGSSNK